MGSDEGKHDTALSAMLGAGARVGRNQPMVPPVAQEVSKAEAPPTSKVLRLPQYTRLRQAAVVEAIKLLSLQV
jgi:hypothetical protein